MLLVLLLGPLVGCTEPGQSWPGLVLLDRSALDARVTFLDTGAPLRVTDAPLLIDGTPETLDADHGELLWVSFDAGDIALESWEIGEDLDPDAVDLVTRDGSPPDFATTLQVTPVQDDVTGFWRIEAPDALLSIAQADLRDVTDVFPVALEDAAGAGGGAASAPGGASSRSPVGSRIHQAAGALPRTAVGVVSETDRRQADVARASPEAGAPDASALNLGDTDAAALVGLHETGDQLLLLSADGSWRAGISADAPGGRWMLSGTDLLLAHEELLVVLAVDDTSIDLAAFPC